MEGAHPFHPRRFLRLHFLLFRHFLLLWVTTILLTIVYDQKQRSEASSHVEGSDEKVRRPVWDLLPRLRLRYPRFRIVLHWIAHPLRRPWRQKRRRRRCRLRSSVTRTRHRTPWPRTLLQKASTTSLSTLRGCWRQWRERIP